MTTPTQTVNVLCLPEGQIYNVATNNLEGDDILHWWDPENGEPTVGYCGKDISEDKDRPEDLPVEKVCAGCYVQWAYGD